EDGRATRSRHAAPASRAWMRVGAVLVAAALPAVLLYAVERPTAAASLELFDDFNGAAGTRPDSARWGYDVGGGGWGNDETQVYTDAPENAA
ncbi:glycoside hydrolase, partial [Mycobacterium sp. ITM-2017-0098]